MANVAVSGGGANPPTTGGNFVPGFLGSFIPGGARVDSANWTPPSTEPTNNLPFDARGYRASALTGQIIQSGRMYSTWPVGGQTFSVYFQFNPTEIDVSYGFDATTTGNLPPQYNPTAVQGQAQGLMLNQTISFSLLFDRTYEVWTGPKNAASQSLATGTRGGQGLGYWNSEGPYQFGAQWDVWAVERLVGVFGQIAGKPTGPPMSYQVTVELGGQRFGQNLVSDYVEGIVGGTAAGGFVTFDGWITDLSATYTRFDANMVPTRATVQVSLMKVMSRAQQDSTNPPDNSAGSVSPAGVPVLSGLPNMSGLPNFSALRLGGAAAPGPGGP